MKLRQSFWAMLGIDSVRDENLEFARVEEIRSVMLNAIVLYCTQPPTSLERSIIYAQSIQALWFLRPNLMQAIAACRDEKAAMQVMGEITPMFDGYIPSPKTSRLGARGRG